MSERDLDSKAALLLRDSRRQPVKADGGPSFAVARHFDLPPAHAPRSREGLHRLVHSLLGGDSGGRMPSGIGASGEVLPFTVRKEPGHGVLPFVGQEGPDSLQIYKVNAHANNRHRRAHQNSATPRNGAGTARYPPSTNPR